MHHLNRGPEHNQTNAQDSDKQSPRPGWVRSRHSMVHSIPTIAQPAPTDQLSPPLNHPKDG
jgi:hypothetical protein